MINVTIEEIWGNAREKMAPQCRVCKVCNGVACRGEIPGAGAIGDGSSWTACVEFLQSVKLNMDTIYENRGQDTAVSLFGQTLKFPILVAPIGGMGLNYGGAITDKQYMEAAVEGANMSGIIAFTGDGPVPGLFSDSINVMNSWQGKSVSIFKPWSNEKLIDQLKNVENANGIAFGIDIDAAGFANMGSLVNSISPKSIGDLRALVKAADIPFVLKGIMTVSGAQKALEAGAYAIVVSTHGGRVMPSAPATCAVLPEIRASVGDKLKIIVDGGIRTGADIFKALALGADAVMIGRPYAIAACGGGAEGVKTYTELLGAQLKNIMLMCGTASISEINYDKVSVTY